MKVPLRIDRAKAAALCVDLQEEHRQDSRYLVEDYSGILRNVARLQAAARSAGIPVYHSAYVVDAGTQPLKPFHPMTTDGRSAFSDVGDPLTAVCPEVGPAGDEMLLLKTDASSFAQGDLRVLLRARGVEWLVVTGVWTEACVAATVKDAVETGLRVLLVKDACGSGTAAMHQTAVLNIANRLYGGAVTTTDSACRLIAGEAVEVWMVEGSVPIRYGFSDAAGIYDGL